MEPLLEWLAGVQSSGAKPGRPLVTLSYAQSLDGCLTIYAGQPTRLSGSETSRMTHQLRAAHDGILVGIGTVLVDDPRLNVRLVEGRDPRPIVLDTRLRIPDGCKLLERESNLPWIVTGPNADIARCAALRQRGLKVFAVPSGRGGGVDLPAALTRLQAEGIASLMVEGGARVIAAFLRAGLVDAAVVTIAPVWLGGQRITDEVLLDWSGSEQRAPGLRMEGSARMGADLVLWGRFEERSI